MPTIVAQSLLLAAAAGNGGAPPNPMAQLIATFGPFVLLAVVFYLMAIRPQQQKAKAHRELVSQLKAGDAVVTNGGIYGTVSAVRERTLMLKVGEQVEIEVARAAIATVRGKEEQQD